jgi:hypothetical protein
MCDGGTDKKTQEAMMRCVGGGGEGSVPLFQVEWQAEGQGSPV